MPDGKSKFLKFLKNNYIIIILFLICAFLVFYNLGSIEFWGEDEAQTLLCASRFILGLSNDSLNNVTAIYRNITFASVILVQVPFIFIFGVSEIAARFPSAIMVLLTFIIILRISKLFLDRKTTNLILLLFTISGAAGLFRSAIGVIFYIFFILAGFYFIEKFLYHKDISLRYKTRDLISGMMCAALSIIFVPDAYFFMPFFIIIILINIRRIGLRKLALSLIGPVFILGFFIYFQFFNSKKLTGSYGAVYEHFITRKEGLTLVFNIKSFILGFITSYSIFFLTLFISSCVFLIVLAIKKKIKIPGIILRLILLFSLHGIIWMFLTEKENGHLMNGFPVFIFITGYAVKCLFDIIGESKLKINVKKGLKAFFIILLGCFFALNLYHSFIQFNDLSLDKQKYPLIYNPNKLPAGYISGHKVGIKSAAYLLRKIVKPNEYLVSDKGTAFSFIYMGGDQVVYSTSNAIEYMRVGEDIYNKYRIRFIGISYDFQNKEYLKYIDSRGFNKITIKSNDKEIYYIYDVLERENKNEVIEREQYDWKYFWEYGRPEKAISFFSNF